MREAVTSLVPVVKHATVLAVGSATSQALLLLTAPILTRLYDPAAFGAFGMITAIMAVPATAANLRLDQAIVLPRMSGAAAHLVLVATVAALAIALLVLVLALLGWPRLAAVGLADLLWFGPPWLLAFGVYQALEQWAIRRERFADAAIAQGIRASTMVAVQWTIGLLGDGVAGLLLGQLLGQLVGMAWLLGRADLRRALAHPRWRRAAAVVRRYREFPAFSGPQAVVNTLSHHVPTFLLGVLISPEAAGYYWLAYRVMMVPSGLLEQALRTAFYQRLAAAAQEREPLVPLVRRLVLLLGGLGILPLTLLFAYGPAVFVFVFGDHWEAAGRYGRWLALWWYCGLISLPCIAAVPLARLQRAFLGYEVLLAGARATALAIGALGGPVAAVAGFAITGALFNLALAAYVVAALARQARPPG